MGSMSIAVLILLVCLYVSGKCPNDCNGHGQCGRKNKCMCYEGYNGGAPDCSYRECPNGTAWADLPYADDSAHQLAQCSNAGLCNRQTGACECFEGFSGFACQRLACPSQQPDQECSGHGICSSIKDINLFHGVDYDTTGQLTVGHAGDGYGVDYPHWDHSSIRMCECDRGFFGADCSIRACPKGDDPVTIYQDYRQLLLNVSALTPYVLEGLLGIEFGDMVSYIDLDNPHTCGETLSNSGLLGAVGCDMIGAAPGGYAFVLTFYSWPEIPRENNLFFHSGNPNPADFRCDVSRATVLTRCLFRDPQTINTLANIREFAYCSNRGICDFHTGECQCKDGFQGPSCSNVTSVFKAKGGSDSLPGLTISALNASYTNTVLRLDSDKSEAPDFGFINATTGRLGLNTVFEVVGDGTVNLQDLWVTEGGLTVVKGGVQMNEGLTMSDGELHVNGDYSTTNRIMQVKLYNRTAQLPTTYEAFSVGTKSTSFSHRIIELQHDNDVSSATRVDRFTIQGGGKVELHSGGIEVTGGMTVHTWGVRTAGGMTVTDGSLYVVEGGGHSRGGLTVQDRGLKVKLSGAKLSGGMTVVEGAFIHAGGYTINAGGLTFDNVPRQALVIGTRGLYITGGITIPFGGMSSTGGLTVESGMNIGGVMEVENGGVHLDSPGGTSIRGITVYDDAVYVTGGLTVTGTGGVTFPDHAGGLSSSGSVTVGDGGVVTHDGMVQVLTEGAAVELGGTSIYSGGAVAQSLTVWDVGMHVEGDLNVFWSKHNDHYIAGDSGLDVTGGMTVIHSSDGAHGGKFIENDGGITVVGGLTVIGEPPLRLQNAATTFSDRRLKTNVVPIKDALGKVDRLQGVYFNWVQNEPSGMSFDEDSHLGVIAQEVLSVLPEAIDTQDKSKYLKVDYTSLVPLLIEAIHDLEEVIDRANERRRRASKDIVATTTAVTTLLQLSGSERERERGDVTMSNDNGIAKGYFEQSKASLPARSEPQQREQREQQRGGKLHNTTSMLYNTIQTVRSELHAISLENIALLSEAERLRSRLKQMTLGSGDIQAHTHTESNSWIRAQAEAETQVGAGMKINTESSSHLGGEPGGPRKHILSAVREVQRKVRSTMSSYVEQVKVLMQRRLVRVEIKPGSAVALGFA